MSRWIQPLLVGLLVCWGACLGLAASNAPGHYVRKSNWHESLLASLEALAARGIEDGLTPFESDRLRGGDPAQRISVPLAGAKELYLFVTGVPDVKWAVADWAEAKLIRADGSAESLTQPTNFTVLLGRWEKDLTLKSGLYQKMRLNGQTFDRGLNVQADSIIRVPLDGTFARFEAVIGVDDWAGTNGTVRFSVLGARSGAVKRLWAPLMRDFPTGPDREKMKWEIEDRIFEFDWRPGDWGALARRYAQACRRVPPLATEAAGLATGVKDQHSLERLRANYHRSRELGAALTAARSFDFDALRSALEDLITGFPGKYPQENLTRFVRLEKAVAARLDALQPDRLETWTALAEAVTELESFQREALLANPLLDFDRLLALKRVPLGGARRTGWEGYGHGEFLGIPRQSSWNYGTMPNVTGWTNEIAVLSPVRPEGQLATLFKPAGTPLVNDLELHWDADKLLFSMPDTNRNWQVHELALSPSTLNPQPSTKLRQLTPSVHHDVHNYDGIYLPNGEIIFLSTAPLQGVPCNAGVIVGMMYKMGPNGERIRQLTFEQDHDYTPSVLNNGRVLYLRWDYTDTPHVWNRLLMSMNPDGTGQMEYTGANSYWPNAMFFARAIPSHPTKIVTIVTGHHEGRVGELFLFDPAKGRHETDGVVQRIPRKGPPVVPKIEDKLTEHSWPKFLHPWPLSDKYFLVACKPSPDALWGIYLVDVFDNLVLVKEEEGVALLEPVPLAKRPKPPVIPDKVQPEEKQALVYMEDIYSGPGLKGVPRGTVKALRLFTYHFGYQRLAGIDHRVGADGPWEAKRVLGTVPVESDGSALFHVPAKTPISFQPLDAEGKAVALMRSWMSAMPGESVSCVGCHDRQSGAPPGTGRRLALTGPTREITPWRGPVRGFSFSRDVQPVLDKYCVGCHDGRGEASDRSAPSDRPAHALPDLRRDQGGFVVYRGGQLDGQFQRIERKGLLGKYGAVFDPSYVALRQFVRVGGLESDLHLLPPREFAADTSELIQMLAKGHHNVKLDAEAWDRLVTWIDLNAPCHGTWAETAKIPGDQCQRRLELRQLYGGVAENCEEIPDIETDYDLPKPVLPEPEPALQPATLAVDGWPFSAAEAKSRQAAAGPITRLVDLGGGLMMEFVRIPAGAFIMGDTNGAPDERTLSVQRINQPFWMAKCEVSNEQFAKFNPGHDSRFEHRSSWWFDEEYTGWPLNRPRQPVVRVSWEEAVAFCRWLSEKLGEEVTLPSEAQWEWACRAGTATPLSYGDLEADFSPFANLGDANLRKLADEGWRPKSPDLVAKESRFDDGALVTAEIGRYAANAWGLHDLHGNVSEWTRSDYGASGKKVIRGGSWRDRPKLCRSASRWAYDPWQKVFNVGFRVILDPEARRLAAK
ncbi:MAG: SUMF1/EgtB/PvdO family nonheme iron enzyme [Verrucomicrobia bacterium]|nr:SUMF1/EgtB/PvdO family nonheme iron enzyme [Verrucomicrobiota bacterium]